MQPHRGAGGLGLGVVQVVQGRLVFEVGELVAVHAEVLDRHHAAGAGGGPPGGDQGLLVDGSPATAETHIGEHRFLVGCGVAHFRTAGTVIGIHKPGSSAHMAQGLVHPVDLSRGLHLVRGPLPHPAREVLSPAFADAQGVRSRPGQPPGLHRAVAWLELVAVRVLQRLGAAAGPLPLLHVTQPLARALTGGVGLLPAHPHLGLLALYVGELVAVNIGARGQLHLVGRVVLELGGVVPGVGQAELGVPVAQGRGHVRLGWRGGGPAATETGRVDGHLEVDAVVGLPRVLTRAAGITRDGEPGAPLQHAGRAVPAGEHPLLQVSHHVLDTLGGPAPLVGAARGHRPFLHGHARVA